MWFSLKCAVQRETTIDSARDVTDAHREYLDIVPMKVLRCSDMGLTFPFLRWRGSRSRACQTTAPNVSSASPAALGNQRRELPKSMEEALDLQGNKYNIQHHHSRNHDLQSLPHPSLTAHTRSHHSCFQHNTRPRLNTHHNRNLHNSNTQGLFRRARRNLETRRRAAFQHSSHTSCEARSSCG